jgi:hypothetical protein
LLWLREGDASTRFFYAHANIRRRKNHIHSLMVDGVPVRSEDGMAQAIHAYFDSILGTPSSRSNTMNMDFLQLPRLDAVGLDCRFTEEEVWSTIKSLHLDKSPEPDGFTSRFFHATWDIVRPDFMAALEAFWCRDTEGPACFQ